MDRPVLNCKTKGLGWIRSTSPGALDNKISKPAFLTFHPDASIYCKLRTIADMMAFQVLFRICRKIMAREFTLDRTNLSMKNRTVLA